MAFTKRCIDTLERANAVIRELRSSSMLSAISGAVRDVISTGAFTGSKPTRTLGASTLDYAMSKVTGVRSRYMGEAAAEVNGWFKGVPAFLKAEGRRLRAVREIDEIRMAKTAEGLPTINAGEGAIPGQVGKVVRAPLSVRSSLDLFWYDNVFHGEFYKRALRLAKQTGRKVEDVYAEQVGHVERANKIQSELDDFLKRLKEEKGAGQPITRGDAARVRRLEAQLKEVRGKSFASEAAAVADRTVFTAREGQSMDKALDGLDQMAHYVPLVNLVMPFRRTTANVVRETLRGSPVGMVWAARKAMQYAQAGVPKAEIQGRLADDMSQAIMGTAIMYYFMHLAASGHLKAAPFKQREVAKRATQEAAGIVTNSVQIGDWSIPVDRLEPFGSYALTAAKIMEDAKTGGDIHQDVVSRALQANWELTLMTAKPTFLDPLAEFTNAIGDSKLFAKYAQSVGGSFVPRAFTQFDQRIKAPPEEVLPTVAGGNFTSGFLNALPFTGETKLGLFGEERKAQAPGASLLFGRTGKIGNDPLATEMLRVGAYHSPPQAVPTTVRRGGRSFTIDISAAEQRLATQAKGRAQRMAVEQVVNSPRYAQLPQTPAGDMLRKMLIDRAFQRAGQYINGRVQALKAAKVPLTERGILGR